MADPIPPLAVSVVVVGLCAGVDWLARRAGVYVGSEVAWPERVRVRTRAVAGDQPYRAALTHDARRAIAEGVPAPVSTATIVGALEAQAASGVTSRVVPSEYEPVARSRTTSLEPAWSVTLTGSSAIDRSFAVGVSSSQPASASAITAIAATSAHHRCHLTSM